MSDVTGKALSVLGPIDPDKLGVTLTHEHLFIDEVPVWLQLPEETSQRWFSRQAVSLETLAWVRFHPYSNEDALRLDDEEMMADEALRFRDAGGNTIVDATSTGLGRDVHALKKLSLRTGINVIAGSGYYVAKSHSADVQSKDSDDIRNEIANEIRVGIGNSGVRAGIIGEIGTTYPWGTNEEKVLVGAARAQKDTGAPIYVHPGHDSRHPRMILDILEKEAVDLRRVVMCHMDRRIADLNEYRSILDRGCFVEFDLFGQAWHPWFLDFPNDNARVDLVKRLTDAGYADKILLSHDIDNKILLHHYGGPGYDHILVNIVPMMVRVMPRISS